MTPPDEQQPDTPVVSSAALRAEELRLRYLEIIDRPEIFPTPTNWQYIIDNRMTGLGPALYHKYLVALDLPEDDREPLHQAAIKYFPEYLRAVPRGYAAHTVYSDVTTMPDTGLRLIHELELFDAAEISRLLDLGHTAFALGALDAYSSKYDADDLAAMERLHRRLHDLPELGRIENRRNILGNLVPRYICPAGHVCDASQQFCTHSGCGLDIHGITRPQADAIALFDRRLRALRSLLDR